MAKKKKKKSGKRGKRGRMGKPAGQRAQQALLVIGGAALSRTIDAILPDDMDIDPRIIPAAKVLLGVFGPSFFKDPKWRDIAEQVADGLLAVGSMELFDSFGFFEGVGLPKMSKNRSYEPDDAEEFMLVLEGYDEINENVLAENVLANDVVNDGVVVNDDMDMEELMD